MKIIVACLFFCFFFSNCSRIGFHTGDHAPHDFVIDYKFNSTLEECNGNEEGCVSNVEDTPFLKGVRENQPGHLTEYFEISIRNELEILFILDVSDSMNDNLKKTGENMQAILSYIQDKNWRMAFTTADHGDHNMEKKTSERWESYSGSLPRFGKLMKLEKGRRVLDQFILNQDTSEYEQIFKDTLTRNSECNLPPYCQGNNEQPLRALKAAINRYRTDTQNNSFFEPNVDTVVLIITDEDERRNDTQNATKAEEVIDTYEQMFAKQKKRLFGFSVSIQDEECYKNERGGFLLSRGAAYGHIIGRLAELTGGRNVSLCSKNYGAALTDISKVTRSLVQSLVLQKIFYIPETVRVSLFPPQPHVSWKLYGRKVVFSDDIQAGTQVAVSYRYE